MKKLFAACVLSLFAASAWCEPTAKAVWDANAKTFTFYYDENTYEGEGITQYALTTAKKYDTKEAWDSADWKSQAEKVVFDESFKACKPGSLNSWFSDFSSLTTIEHLDYLDTTGADYAFYMFSGCSSLTSLDLSSFDTTKLRARELFKGCSSIEVLDLTSFTNVLDIRSMFNGMTKLRTIIVTELFALSTGVSTDNKTFSGCSALVGGAGTSYADKKVATHEYARIDGGPNSATPGYFTLGQKQVPPKVESVTASDLTYNGVKITVAGESLNDGTITVELIAGGETVKTEELSDFGDVKFAELTPETEYSVKVTAKSAYGTTINTDCAFTTPEKPADYWLYDVGEGSVSWSEWKFNATLANDGTIKVGTVTSWPDVAMALDFSLPVKDGDGTVYVISELSPAFGHHDGASSYKPAGYEPQCLRVGLLTLPGEGLLTIGQAAFAACANATGVVSFPSTVTTIGTSCFADCDLLQIDGSTIPDGVTQIPQYCFRGAKAMFGDVVLPNATLVADSAFQGAGITSATFGPDLKSIGGNYTRGAFQDCKALTNLVFDSTSKVRIASGYTFNGCSGLEELNLCGVVDFAIASDKNDYSNISGCSKLKKIIFGAGLTNLMCNAMAGASALEEVVFEGVPPVGFGMPYLSPTDSKGAHATGYDNKSITTYVHRDLINTPNEAGKCWADYAANGKIAGVKESGNTTWAAEYVYEGIDLTKRQLVTIEPAVKPGLAILFR